MIIFFFKTNLDCSDVRKGLKQLLDDDRSEVVEPAHGLAHEYENILGSVGSELVVLG